MTSNYPPDYNPEIDSGDDEVEEVSEFDDSDEYRERLHDDAMHAMTELSIPEDEAENQLEDLGL